MVFYVSFMAILRYKLWLHKPRGSKKCLSIYGTDSVSVTYFQFIRICKLNFFVKKRFMSPWIARSDESTVLLAGEEVFLIENIYFDFVQKV